MCDGPRTDAAGFTGTTWPVTSRSQGCRTAARRCLTVGAACCCREAPPTGRRATAARLHATEPDCPRTTPEGPAWRGRRLVRVGVAEARREEFRDTPARLVTGRGDQHRKCRGGGDRNELVQSFVKVGAAGSTIWGGAEGTEGWRSVRRSGCKCPVPVCGTLHAGYARVSVYFDQGDAAGSA
jgi:hypothetical protein